MGFRKQVPMFQVNLVLDAKKVTEDGFKDFATMTLTYDNMTYEDVVVLEEVALLGLMTDLVALGRKKLEELKAAQTPA